MMVEADGLGRRFGEVAAVEGLTFAAARGELFGIVGPDGAGKTTTLRMLAGVLRPTAGSARVDGVDVAREPERVKDRIAYMAQRFGLYADLTVRENLEFYADLYQVPRPARAARIARLHEFSGLGPFEGRLAGQLSGGMQQKLSLSCALVHEPPVLLLDEPTFGVDPISRRDLWLILHEVVGRGVTVVVSTAYLDEAERCDRVVLLHRGRAAALDRPAALQARLAGKILAVSSHHPRPAEQFLRRHPAVRRAALFGHTIHVTLRPGLGWESVAPGLAAEGIQVAGVEPVAPSLEDVFLDLMADAETPGD